MHKVFIVGITGMLGSTLLKTLVNNSQLKIYGSSRNSNQINAHKALNYEHIGGLDILDENKIFNQLSSVKPDTIINCAGVIKQIKSAQNPLDIIPINSLFPHKLEKFCNLKKISLIHISTDCVFSGRKGNYTEIDISDAEDLYGKSKYIGEVYGKNSLTLRTSIIGHENGTTNSLLEWFLSQNNIIEGYTNAIFSGLTTLELSSIIEKIIINFGDLSGLYQVSSKPISKFDLLTLVKDIYQKDIEIIPSSKIKINRSLNSKKFQNKTGISVPEWTTMIKSMYINNS